MRSPTSKPILIGMLALMASTGLHAQTGSNFKLSGFASIVGGKVFGGSSKFPLGNPDYDAPSYVADWFNAGVYEKKFSLTPETRIGVQGTYEFTKQFSATAQVTSRAVDADPSLEWAYLTYKTGDWEVQLGRKRIPLYYYSDFQDIGVAYPWITPPSDLYGWDATNYNGASLRYRGSSAGVNYVASLFAGAEEVKDSRYFRLSSTDTTDLEWKNIVGADLELSKDWWTLRFVYMENDVDIRVRETGDVGDQRMQAYGVAFNADFDDWFVLSEIGQNVRKSANGILSNYKAPAYSITAGYRLGNWTPFASLGAYWERTDEYLPVRWRTYAAGLRYDINPGNALKLQYQYNQDENSSYTGNASILRLSYDTVF